MATETISEDKFEAFSKYDFDNDEEYKVTHSRMSPESRSIEPKHAVRLAWPPF